MSQIFHIVVCGSLVPDPLQTLEPVQGVSGPGLKNESMLPTVLDPWASHSLYEAANLAKNFPGSKIWLVSLGPKAKLQQLMMTIAQKVAFELVALDGPAGGFTDSFEVAQVLAGAIEKIQGLDRSRLLLFGGCSSATRDAGVTMQMVGEKLGITEQFLGADELTAAVDGTIKILERVEGGKYQISQVTGPPIMVGWATGNLPIPSNNPQVGMANMKTILPALQKAQPAAVGAQGLDFVSVDLPKQERQTRLVKDVSVDEMAKDIVTWIKS